MSISLVKHGTQKGYKTELATGSACARCKAAHLEYNRQYTKTYKAKGIKYSNTDVLAGPDSVAVVRPQSRTRYTSPAPAPEPTADTSQGQGQNGPGRDSTASRLAGALGRLAGSQGRSEGQDGAGSQYVSETPPDYLTEIEHDPEPDGQDWEPDDTSEYMINAAGMAKIEENLGTYLSIVGMTAEMVDPYCGTVLAENFDNMVKKWARVVSHYPKAAALFLDGKGGTIFAWITALQATWPVLAAIFHHHLARDIKVENGRVFRKDGAQRPDATMPPMPEDYQYSAT